MPTTSRNSPKQSTDTPESMVSSFFNSQSKPNSVPSDVDQQAAADKVALYHPRDNDDHTKSILSSFLKYLPTEGKQSLAEFIMRDKVDDDVLYSLSNHLFSFILFPMKTRNLTPNFTPSPFPNEDAAITSDSIASLDQQATRPEQLEELKKLCLERDNFCCLATGFVELFESQREPGLRSMPTELAHIVPFSRSWCGSTEQPREHSIISQEWATLAKCFPNIELGPNDINHPRNLMTLITSVHQAFGAFHLIFEPMEETNKYNLLPVGSGYPTGLDLLLPTPDAKGDRILTLESHNNADLPSRNLLQTHAALARILHASGIARHIDEVMEEREDIRGLASDGSSNLQRLLFVF